MSNQENELRVYDQLCQSYRAIDDFRAKLLGFLPLATGAGLWTLLDKLQDAAFMLPGEKGVYATVGAFGVAITLGLFSYEIYGIKKCGALITAGRLLEVYSLKVVANGQFTSRPQNVGAIVNEPFAAGIIYPAVLAAWTYFALAFASPNCNPLVPFLVFLGGLPATVIFDFLLRRKYDDMVVEAEKEPLR